VETEQQTGLVVKNLSCSRDDRLLFDNINFSLLPGQIVLLEGSNGSGKTTLLRILCGFRAADDGGVYWRGVRITDSSDCDGIAYVGHADGAKKELTVLDNLRFALALGRPGHYTLEQALETVQLAGYDDNPVHTLSAGQKRRLSLARLLISNSLLWILDEPFTALDRQGVSLIEALIADQVERGGMVILTSHQALNLPHLPVQQIQLASCH
jgi:heme exporter protein A